MFLMNKINSSQIPKILLQISQVIPKQTNEPYE
jgi:hypothetical protein